MSELHHINTVIPEEFAGQRIDQVLARMFRDYSRSRLKAWIEAGKVLVDTRTVKPKDIVAGGEQVELWAEAQAEERWTAEAMDLEIVYEDDELIVLDKPAGLVVHPGAGNRAGTLLNALLHHDPGLAAIPRAGLVHRLDKDTSGLLVVARTLGAHRSLVNQLQARTVGRHYLAVVNGVLVSGGTVDAAVGRHPVQRTRMAVVAHGREARTHYRVVRRFRAHTLVELKLDTGRTHQIRVHMSHLGHPLVGDPVYARRPRLPSHAGPALVRALTGFRRQALHAAELALVHPRTREPMHWSSPLPPDMRDLLAALEDDVRAASA